MDHLRDGDVHFGLLGPVAAWRDGRELALGNPQQRIVLALLLLHRGELVSLDRLLDALWPSAPPRRGVEVARTYVSRLRSGPLARAGLETHRGGYLLRLPRESLDAERLERLAGHGRTAVETGDPAGAEASLRAGLALVRGTPLPELPDDPAARQERERLGELVDVAREDLVEAQLAQGRHREALPHLRAVVAADPLRERAWSSSWSRSTATAARPRRCRRIAPPGGR